VGKFNNIFFLKKSNILSKQLRKNARKRGLINDRNVSPMAGKELIMINNN